MRNPIERNSYFAQQPSSALKFVFGNAVRLARIAFLLLASGASVNALNALEVSLSWTDNSDNEEGFAVERSDDGGDFYQIGTTLVDVASYVDTTAQLGVTHEYRVNAFNEFGYSGYTNTLISLVENSAPTISQIDDVSMVENGNFPSVEFSIGDEHTESPLLSITGTSSNQLLVRDEDIVISGTGSLRTVSLEPVADAFGALEITLTVSDGELEASSRFELTINTFVATPQILPLGGAFAWQQQVELVTETPDSTIYYTVDGSEPSESSAVYSNAILVSSDMTLKAMAVDNNQIALNSEVVSTYFDLNSWNITGEWMNIETLPQSGNFAFSFDLTPESSGIDLEIGLSETTASSPNALGVGIRFNPDGTVDVRNGDSYTSETNLSYTGGARYTFIFEVDMLLNVFSVDAVLENGDAFRLATEASFRDGVEGAESFAYLAAVGSLGGSGSVVDTYIHDYFSIVPEIAISEVASPNTVLLHSGEPINVDLDVSDYSLIELVEYYIDGELVASTELAPFSVSIVSNIQGEHTLTAKAKFTNRNETLSVDRQIVIEAPLTDSLLVESLRSVTIDASDLLGSTGYDSSLDVFSLTNETGTIGGTMDSNHFSYLLVQGSFELSVRLLETYEGDDSSVAGLMFRTALYGRGVEHSILRSFDGKILYRSRDIRSADTNEQVLDLAVSEIQYLRITKTDTLIQMSGSVDGLEWIDYVARPIEFGERSFAGMALASGESNSAEADFSQLRFDGILGTYDQDAIVPLAPINLLISQAE